MKRLLSLFMALVMAIALPAIAWAETIDGGSFTVTYTAGGDMTDDYSSSEYISRVSGMQPGDSITFEVVTRHENDTTADWYLTNEVVKSLEEGDAQGSAYGYLLAYEGPAGSENSRTLYESTHVGGDSSEGLAEATNALDSEDYLFLDTLRKGQEGKVTLTVTLDGDTESNAYFNTLARVKMAFAVEENVGEDDPNNPSSSTTTTTTTRTTRTTRRRRTVLAKTGDPTSNLPLYLAAVGAGIVCIALAVRTRRSREDDEEDQQ